VLSRSMVKRLLSVARYSVLRTVLIPLSIQLEVLDTSGAEQFTSLHEVYIKVGDQPYVPSPLP
jgi:hypothetical protein